MTSFNEFIENRLTRGSIDWRRCYFRGHSNSNWHLTPGLLRYNKYPRECNSWIEFEDLLLLKFKKSGYPLIDHKPSNKLGWLAIAQHNGLPTRLLDWSKSPLHALFFSVENLEHETDFAVWGFYPDVSISETEEKVDLYRLDKVCIYQPFHLDTKIAAQQGAFSVHPLIEDFQSDSYNENIVKESGRLFKFIFNKKLRSTIKNDLDLMGINYFSLFPNLNGLAMNIKWEISMASSKGFYYRSDMR